VGQELQAADRADTLASADTPLDLQALYDYLYFHVIPSPRTVFQGVSRIPAGHSATVDAGRVVLQRDWVPAFRPASQHDFAALQSEFQALLEAAVARQLDGGKPGCFLSGGTDSSTVAGMLARVADKAGLGKAHTYSIGFDASGYDEMAYARIAASHFGTEHHEYYVTPEDLVNSIPAVAAYYDQPFGNSSAVPAFCCARMARDDGVTRILAGDGGDELFGGNSRYALQRVFGIWEHVPEALQAVLRAGFCNPLVSRTPVLKKGAGYIRRASVPLPDRLQDYNLLERLGAANVLEPAFQAAVDDQAPLAQQRAVWAGLSEARGVNHQLAFDWRYTLAENDLPKVCGTSALAGIGVGFPMLDDALVDFSMRLPLSYKLKGLRLRWFFKEALRGFLPDAIITKKKQGFGLPFGVWAHQHTGLRALAADSLASLGARGIVQPRFVRWLMDEKLAEHPHYYGEMVWILLMLEQWFRHHRPDWRMPV
jgi:asparagine synthase (glutamine-hydrolysing)